MVTSYLVPGHTDGSAAYLAGGTLYLGDSADSGKDGNVLPAKRLLAKQRYRTEPCVSDETGGKAKTAGFRN